MLEREQGWCFEGPRKDMWEKSLHDSGSVVCASPCTPILSSLLTKLATQIQSLVEGKRIHLLPFQAACWGIRWDWAKP